MGRRETARTAAGRQRSSSRPFEQRDTEVRAVLVRVENL
jgi:hypothetical protein